MNAVIELFSSIFEIAAERGRVNALPNVVGEVAAQVPHSKFLR